MCFPSEDRGRYQNDPDVCFAAVCDGMGGAQGGDLASKIAIDTAREIWKKRPAKEKTEDTFKAIVKTSNERIYHESVRNPIYHGMGTTMVLAAVTPKEIFFCNIGDSRGYLITNGGVQQITKDHSAVQQLVDCGRITERQAKIHPNKNIITRAVGIEKSVHYDLFRVDASPGDIAIICTDGLTNFVDENEIQFESAGGSFEEMADRLIELANNRGGTDNITIVAIQI